MRTLDLDSIKLEHGGHRTFDEGHCFMETVAYVAGEKHTDHPACVSPVLAAFGRQWNDDLDDERRQRLKPLIGGFIGTAHDGHDERRGWMCADWLVRTYTPAWLDLAGVTGSAAALRALPELVDLATIQGARPDIDTAMEKARAARAAAGAAAWATADTAVDGAVDATWAAGVDAAGNAAWAAAVTAAEAAAVTAAEAALQPTVDRLQESAIDLLDRMCSLEASPPSTVPERTTPDTQAQDEKELSRADRP